MFRKSNYQIIGKKPKLNSKSSCISLCKQLFSVLIVLFVILFYPFSLSIFFDISGQFDLMEGKDAFKLILIFLVLGFLYAILITLYSRCIHKHIKSELDNIPAGYVVILSVLAFLLYFFILLIFLENKSLFIIILYSSIAGFALFNPINNKFFIKNKN